MTTERAAFASDHRCAATTLLSVAFAFIALTLAGCASIARNAACAIATERLGDDLKVMIPSGEDYLKCLMSPGGCCPPSPTELTCDLSMPSALRAEIDLIARTPGSRSTWRLGALAADALDSETISTLCTAAEGLFKTAGVRGETPPAVPMGFGFSRVIEDVDRLTEAASLEAFTALRVSVDHALANYAARTAQTRAAQADDTQPLYDLATDERVRTYHRTVGYVETYLRAYFRNGQFISVELDLAKLKAKLEEKLGKNYPGLEDLAKAILAKAQIDPNAKIIVGKIGSGGFTARSGGTLKFPDIEVKITPGSDQVVAITDINPTAIGRDLIRVVVEAIFDARDRLPCISGATALDVPGANHPLNNPTLTACPGLSDAHFQSVDEWAKRLDAGASALVARLIRGGGPIALNNEAIAQLIEALVGVLVKKVTEKALWCVYSCNPGLREEAVSSELRPTTLSVSVDHRPPSFSRGPWR